MNALLLALVLAQTTTEPTPVLAQTTTEPTPVLAQTTTEPKPAPVVSPAFRLHVGAQLGLPILLGVGTTGTFHAAGKPRFDVDLWWEPSGYLQSYSVGGAWRPADRFFFVGARLRLVQFQPPWTTGFNGANDNHFGVSLETGVRLRVGPADKGVIHVALSGTYLPTQAVNLRWLIGLTAGFSWAVWER